MWRLDYWLRSIHGTLLEVFGWSVGLRLADILASGSGHMAQVSGAPQDAGVAAARLA